MRRKKWMSPRSSEITLSTFAKATQTDCPIVICDDKSGEVIEKTDFYVFKRMAESYYKVKSPDILVKSISISHGFLYIRLKRR